METFSSWNGLPVKRLIMDGGNFIVYIDTDGDIDWSVTDNYDWDKIDLPRFNAVINRAAILEVPLRDGLDEVVKSNNKRLVAESIARALDGDSASAESMLSMAQSALDARSRETSRRWYLLAAVATTAPLSVAGLFLWYVRPWAIASLGQSAFWFLVAAFAGSVGALFSVIVRSGRLDLETSAGRELHYLEGASRILAGSIAGGATGLAVKAGLFLGPLVEKGKPNMILVLAAIVAGSAERLATSIVTGVGDSDNSSDSKSKQEVRNVDTPKDPPSTKNRPPEPKHGSIAAP